VCLLKYLLEKVVEAVASSLHSTSYFKNQKFYKAIIIADIKEITMMTFASPNTLMALFIIVTSFLL